MALKIRLRQQGRTNRITYRLVVADSKSPRDGKYLEMLGWYSPCETKGQELHVEADRVEFWLNQGAEISDSAKSLVKKAAPSVILSYQTRLLERTEKAREQRKAAKKKA